jgi:hypothetical protein
VEIRNALNIAKRHAQRKGQSRQPGPLRPSVLESEDRAVEEPADDQQARHDADTITKDVDTRHQKHPSTKGDLRRLGGKITSVFTVRKQQNCDQAACGCDRTHFVSLEPVFLVVR